MAPGSPIVLTLYGPNDEIVSSHSRAVITSRFLERAMDLSETMSKMGTSKDVLESLDQLLVDFYGGQFTLAQIKEGGDFIEKISVLKAILNKAGVAFETVAPPAGESNPTIPGIQPR
jgi:hypothetical protein